LRITSREAGKLTLLTFNNQASVVFDGPGPVDNQLEGDRSNDRASEYYSTMVEYEIDETEMTVRQVWQYGENQPELFCSYMSGVNLLSNTENRLMFSCGTDTMSREENPPNAHVVEITDQGEVVFHLEVTNTELSLYRSARIDLYHPNESAK
jgi:arylsulfate sulfotransferase